MTIFRHWNLAFWSTFHYLQNRPTCACKWLNNTQSLLPEGGYVVDNILTVNGVYHQILQITVEDVSLYLRALYSRDPRRVYSLFCIGCITLRRFNISLQELHKFTYTLH